VLIKKMHSNKIESKIEMNLLEVKQSRSLVNGVNPKEIETNSNPKGSLKRIKILIKETLYNSTAQAIIKLLETPIFTLKIFLFLCVILSSGLCSYLIIQLIISYLSYGVSTTSRTLYETPALFPKITICNLNPFTTRYAVEFIKQINKEVFPTIDIYNEEQMSKLDLTIKYNLIADLAFYSKTKMNNLNETEKRKFSRPLEEIMTVCSYNIQDCTANDFSWYFDYDYGNCWTFNSGRNDFKNLSYSSIPGVVFGLRMSLYVNFYQNLTEINSIHGALGALIRIENSSYLTYSNMDGIRLSPGFDTSISVSRSFKSNLPQPYSNCIIDNETNAEFHSELFDLIQNSEYRYKQELCFWQCIQRTLLLECNCTDPTIISILPNASRCIEQNEKEFACYLNLWNGKIKNKIFFVENCQSECPLECYLDEFDASLSSNQIFSNFYLNFLNSNHTNLSNDFQTTQIDSLGVKESFVSFNIFYKSLSYEISSESPQLTLITLFANIGGYLGLFLGVSIFSLFEPIQILIEIIHMKLCRNRLRC
jgi:hypothetical protein